MAIQRLEPVVRQPVTEDAYRALRRSIVDGHFLPGQELRLEALAAQLAVSRTPVREALRRLEAEGLVVFRPNRSVLVAPLSADAVEESYALRIINEGFAIRMTVPDLSESLIARLRELIRLMGSRHAAQDSEAVSQAHSQFHSTLCSPSGLSRLIRLGEELRAQTERYRRALDEIEPHRPVEAVREHAAILEACEAGDGDLASRHLAAHLKTTAERLIHRLDASYRPQRLKAAFLLVAGKDALRHSDDPGLRTFSGIPSPVLRPKDANRPTRRRRA